MIGSIVQAAEFLKDESELSVICHKSPDGDTIGSGFALYYGLLQLGKRAHILCRDEFPQKFSYLFPEEYSNELKGSLVTVDVASPQLLGKDLEPYANQIALCIDHHTGNTMKASRYLVDSTAAATAEVIFALLLELGVTITPIIANCLYTGICTDTGCFCYSNCTAKTHRVAASLIEFGARSSEINRRMFQTKSIGRLRLERLVMDQLLFLEDGKIAVVPISREDFIATGAVPSDFDGIPAILRSIEGVELAITIKEQKDGEFKISVRTSETIDACEFCKQFGGGGHPRAAGCTLVGEMQDVQEKLCQSAKKWIDG